MSCFMRELRRWIYRGFGFPVPLPFSILSRLPSWWRARRLARLHMRLDGAERTVAEILAHSARRQAGVCGYLPEGFDGATACRKPAGHQDHHVVTRTTTFPNLKYTVQIAGSEAPRG